MTLDTYHISKPRLLLNNNLHPRLPIKLP